MNNNAKKWVEELKSGKWNQTIGRLCRDTKQGEAYCCLGVACEVYLQNRPKDPKKEQIEKDLETNGELPGCVREWLGLSGNSGEYGVNFEKSLSIRNDKGKSFKRIAALIERKPKGMFVE